MDIYLYTVCKTIYYNRTGKMNILRAEIDEDVKKKMLNAVTS